MKMNVMLGYLILLLLVTTNVAADINWDARDLNLFVSADSNSNVAFIEVESGNTEFLANCPSRRVKFDKNNKAMLSYIIMLSGIGAKAAFYYDPNGTSLGEMVGHGVGSCELQSLWRSD